MQESKLYEQMWQFMKDAEPSVFVDSSEEGIKRVKAGNYAYLMESSMVEYAVATDCDLMQIGGLLDSKGYGIGMRKGIQTGFFVFVLNERIEKITVRSRTRHIVSF